MKDMKVANEEWRNWIDSEVEKNGLSGQQRLFLIATLAPEVTWYTSQFPSESEVVMRIAKMQSMLDKGINKTEPLWEYRIKFLQWLCI